MRVAAISPRLTTCGFKHQMQNAKCKMVNARRLSQRAAMASAFCILHFDFCDIPLAKWRNYTETTVPERRHPASGRFARRSAHAVQQPLCVDAGRMSCTNMSTADLASATEESATSMPAS